MLFEVELRPTILPKKRSTSSTFVVVILPQSDSRHYVGVPCALGVVAHHGRCTVAVCATTGSKVPCDGTEFGICVVVVVGLLYAHFKSRCSIRTQSISIICPSPEKADSAMPCTPPQSPPTAMLRLR